MTPMLVAHVLGSFLVGWAGRRRRIGFLGFLLVSLLLTPVVALVILILTAAKPGARAAA